MKCSQSSDCKEYEHWQTERAQLIATIDEKIAAARKKAREQTIEDAIEIIWKFQRNHIGMNALVYRGLDYAREEVESLRTNPQEYP